MSRKTRALKQLILASKIAIGSSVAIYIATLLHLSYASSAGIVTLLTILTTRWETLKLSGYRIITFVMSVGLSWMIFQNISSAWVAYGIYLFLMVLLCGWFGWRPTISVNAVIGTHFMASHDFSLAAVKNEFFLVLIGIGIAIVLNLIQNDRLQKQNLVRDMRYVEAELQRFLGELAGYLREEPIDHSVWDDIIALEKQLDHSMEEAFEYRENTMRTHASYYQDYFEMRSKQCTIFHNLHYEMRKIRKLPIQAKIISEYVAYLQEHLREKNSPVEQLDRLEELLDDMKNQPLPKMREEFENRAILYHVLMDLEEFVILKRRFVENLTEEQKKIYWSDC